MLVLGRKVGQRILVGDEIVITVVRLSGGGVRLGIEAPPEMVVVREELADQLKEGKRLKEPKARASEASPATA
jgi:carbon storage regulator